jgi:hypothetical protein
MEEHASHVVGKIMYNVKQQHGGHTKSIFAFSCENYK